MDKSLSWATIAPWPKLVIGRLSFNQQLAGVCLLSLLCALLSANWDLPQLPYANSPVFSAPAVGTRPAAVASFAAAGGPSLSGTSRLPGDAGGSLPVAPGNNRNSYAFGNCTYYVASRRAVPSNWGNARSWYGRAQRSGYKVGHLPAPGAIAWTPSGALGHVAYVEAVSGNQVHIAEMNYAGFNRISRRIVPANAFKYIY